MSAGDKQQEQGTQAVPPTVTFHFRKSSQFRVIHVDGGIGGAIANGNLQINLYSERAAIPRSGSHELVEIDEANNSAKSGDEIPEKKDGIVGVVREAEVGLVMSMHTAMLIRAWRDRHISEVLPDSNTDQQ